VNPTDLLSIRRYAAHAMQSAQPDAPVRRHRHHRHPSPRAALARVVRTTAEALERAADRIHPAGSTRGPAAC
jgi:hypothetical protein